MDLCWGGGEGGSSSAATRLHAASLARLIPITPCRRVSCYARRRLRGPPSHPPRADPEFAHPRSGFLDAHQSPRALTNRSIARSPLDLQREGFAAEALRRCNALVKRSRCRQGSRREPAKASFSERPGDPATSPRSGRSRALGLRPSERTRVAGPLRLPGHTDVRRLATRLFHANPERR